MAPREFWNDRYAVEHYRYGTSPNTFLVEQSGAISRGGRVLCVGDGEGRNGVWLAQHEFDVVTIDASDRGVAKARRMAAERNALLDIRRGLFPDDLRPDERFDAIVLIFIHLPPEARPALHSAVIERLEPGGVVILEAFTPEQLDYPSGGPPTAERLYTREMLAEDFRDLDIEVLEVREVELDEGPGHSGQGSVVRLVARA